MKARLTKSAGSGRSWARAAGGSASVPPSIAAPAWLNASRTMDVQPVPAYPRGCGPPDPVNCTLVTSVTAAPQKPYLDWKLDASGVPAAVISHGRARGPNVWKGLPKSVSMMCTSCGGGTQLADGSYLLRGILV